MAPSIITPPEDSVIKAKGSVGESSGSYATTTEALEAAKARFVERNPISLRLHQEAVKSLPGGNTRSMLHTAPFPVFMKSGNGYQVLSEDGHTYTDFVGELTAGLYGHSHPIILEALTSTLQTVGLSLGATTRLEAQHASLLCERFHLDRVRFTNSGTEANLHAIQGARRYTGKRKVVVFTGGYHGGCFNFDGDRPAENCVDLNEWVMAEYNDVEDARKKIEKTENLAAVLVEGMQGHGPCIVGTDEFLQQIQKSAKKAGSVFIFDEVMTSRLSPGGLQQIIGLKPDITTFGKYLGGGITFGGFGGREEIMKVYDPRDGSSLGHSGTFNNNTLGMAAGFAGLSKVFTPEVAIAHNKKGDHLIGKLRMLSKGTKMTITGRGSIVGIHFLTDGKKDLKNEEERKNDVELKDLFFYEMMEENYWLHRRGIIALIIDTPWNELDRFVKSVESFLRRHENFVSI